MSAGRKQAVMQELLERSFEPHGWTEDDAFEMGLDREVLEFLAARLVPGLRTLETGTGYSTVAFALAGARHTAVSPVSWEHERIREFCAERGVSLEQVEFHEGLSQEVLPNLPGEPLDVVLVDGDHSFPTVFIDFYYGAVRLRPGGIMIVDDTHIRTGDILRRFLEMEEGRWTLVQRFRTAAAFEKLTDVVIDLRGWMAQPFCAELLPPADLPVLDRLRLRLRLRTRLRELLGRGGAGRS